MCLSGRCFNSVVALSLGAAALSGCHSEPSPAVSEPAATATPALDEQYASAGVVLPATAQISLSATPLVTTADVVAWTHRGLSDDQILDRLDRSSTVFHLSTSDELRLRDAGVSDDVVRAMKASAWR